jgi:hypothetical protein
VVKLGGRPPRRAGPPCGDYLTVRLTPDYPALPGTLDVVKGSALVYDLDASVYIDRPIGADHDGSRAIGADHDGYGLGEVGQFPKAGYVIE